MYRGLILDRLKSCGTLGGKSQGGNPQEAASVRLFTAARVKLSEVFSLLDALPYHSNRQDLKRAKL